MFVQCRIPFCCCCLVAESCWTLCDPMDCSPTVLLCPWGSPGKTTGVACHFSPLGDLLDISIEPVSAALAGGFFTTEPQGKP